MLTFLLYFLRAFPAIKTTWEGLLSIYINNELKKMHKKDVEAIRRAVYEQDQRDLERQLFNMEPGRPSGIPGTIIHTDLPNVLPRSEKS